MFETERLIVRAWRDEDRAPFAALNADPSVMRYFPKVLSLEESDAMIDRFIDLEANHGFTFAPAERKADGAFIGFVGIALSETSRELFGMPEIGWRLARRFWGQGYASEAAAAWLRHMWDRTEHDEIVSFTAATNLPSQKVMQRIGMVRRAELDFDHPNVADGHPLKLHVVYTAARPG